MEKEIIPLWVWLMLVGFWAIVGLLGALMRYTKPNIFYGIRTPATLKNPKIWAEIHQKYSIHFCLIGIGFSLLGLFSILLELRTALWMFIYTVITLVVLIIFSLKAMAEASRLAKKL